MPRLIFFFLTFLCWVPWAAATDGNFQSNGVKIAYSDLGNLHGEPVVLIHGYVVTGSLQWTLPGITKALSKNYRVVLYDNRGHGLSGRPHDAAQYGMEMVEDVGRLMDHLGVEKAHIIGYSMGAFIAHKFAARYPKRVKSLILGGAGWLEDGPATIAIDAIADSLSKKKSLEPLFQSLHPPDAPPLTDADIKRVNTMAMLINDPQALAAVAKGMKQLVMTENDVKKVTAPTLCIVGSRDPLVETVKRLESVRPGLQTCYVNGGNHMNTYHLPIFREQIERFLEKQK
jgi:pimeloyl-ACP methyl ester carboxylesterase